MDFAGPAAADDVWLFLLFLHLFFCIALLTTGPFPCTREILLRFPALRLQTQVAWVSGAVSLVSLCRRVQVGLKTLGYTIYHEDRGTFWGSRDGASERLVLSGLKFRQWLECR